MPISGTINLHFGYLARRGCSHLHFPADMWRQMSFFIIERRLHFTSRGLPLCSLCPFCMTFIISFLLIVGCSLYTLYLIYYHFNGGDSHQAKMKIITVVRSLDKCGSPSPKWRHKTSSLLLRVPLGPLLANTSSRCHPSELCHWRADVFSWTSFNGITQIGSFMSPFFVQRLILRIHSAHMLQLGFLGPLDSSLSCE